MTLSIFLMLQKQRFIDQILDLLIKYLDLNLFQIKLMNEEVVLTKLKIIKKVKLNHDSYIYSFRWEGQQFSLGIGQHLRFIHNFKTQQSPEGEQVVRKYTPISPSSQKDVVDILFKIYRPTEKFPKGGLMTTYIQSLNEGDTVNVEGPFGRFDYKEGGRVFIDHKEIKMKRLFLIAGGSGITPIYHTVTQILKLPKEDIQLVLLFANKTQEDIVLRKQLQALTPRIKLFYILDQPPLNWKGFSGYINEHILKEICPLDDKDTLYIHCGPPPMNKLIRDLFNTKYPNSIIFKY